MFVQNYLNVMKLYDKVYQNVTSLLQNNLQ